MNNEGIRTLAQSLNSRQTAYLLAAYDIDQQRAGEHRGMGSAPPSVWRWIEYGPDVARKATWDGPLRIALEAQKLVDAGSGSTWKTLRDQGLVETKYEETRLVVRAWAKRVTVLFIRMTRDGRKVARVLRGEPLTTPTVRKPLSLTALRLIQWGQQHVGVVFHWSEPWEGSGWVPDYLQVLAITRGMRSRGLIEGDASGPMLLTDAGMSVTVESEPNWRARKAGAGASATTEAISLDGEIVSGVPAAAQGQRNARG